MSGWREALQNREHAIAVSLTGGMGNQLFQIAAGLYYSNESGIECLESLGRPRKSLDGVPSALQFGFDDQVVPASEEEVSIFWVKCAGFVLRHGIETKKHEKYFGIGIFIERLVKLFLKMRFKREIISADGVGDTQLIITNRRNLLLGYFQTNSWLANPYVLNTMSGIKFPNEENILSAYRAKAEVEQPLVIHFRIGDYKFEPDIGLLPVDYYHRALEAFEKKQSIGKIWLFSDEPDIAIGKMPERLKSQTEVIHMKDNNDALTLQAMRFGSNYILSNSTFGWWAARLSHAGNPIILVPDKWFKNLPEPEGLVPSTWLRINAWKYD